MTRHKTRQEKIIADLRRRLAAEDSPTKTKAKTQTPSYVFTTKAPYKTSTQAITIGTHYLKFDLIKTLTVIGVIFAAQIVLYFVLK